MALITPEDEQRREERRRRSRRYRRAIYEEAGRQLRESQRAAERPQPAKSPPQGDGS